MFNRRKKYKKGRDRMQKISFITYICKFFTYVHYLPTCNAIVVSTDIWMR